MNAFEDDAHLRVSETIKSITYCITCNKNRKVEEMCKTPNDKYACCYCIAVMPSFFGISPTVCGPLNNDNKTNSSQVPTR